jgi:hypothetical protein
VSDDESAYRSALRVPGSRPDYRRLTPDQSLAFRDAMAPLLRDLAVSSELAPELADYSWDDGQDVVSGFIYQSGLGGRWGIRVQVTWPEVDRVVKSRRPSAGVGRRGAVDGSAKCDVARVP